MRNIIVISSLVDSTIREGQLDTEFLLFRTIDELAQYIEQTPVRADSLFFTKETIPHTNTALNFLSGMLVNPFLKVDSVVYITEKGSSEIPSVNYIVAEKGFNNWEIIEGYLTREYISGIVNGSLRQDTFGGKRKAVYRVPRAAYVQDRIKDRNSLNDKYEDDESYLKDVPPVNIPEQSLVDKAVVCEIKHIVGSDSEERTAFCFLIAQYLAFSGKTLIIEKDTEYHRLTEFVTKSGVQCLQIPISEFLASPNETIEKIRRSESSLICILAFERLKYSYPFISNVLYNNLASDISYFISEDDFTEAPIMQKYTVVIPSNIIGVLSTCEKLDGNYLHLCKFVGVNFQSLPETRIVNGTSLAKILSDVLEMYIEHSPILTVSSLKLGGSSYDLRSIIGG